MRCGMSLSNRKRSEWQPPNPLSSTRAQKPLFPIGCTDLPRANWTDNSGGALQQTTPLPYFDYKLRCHPTLQRRSQAGPARNSSVTLSDPRTVSSPYESRRCVFTRPLRFPVYAVHTKAALAREHSLHK
ncbi:unnamed protein product [Ectocarpus sp. 12 AP-2014]